MQSDMQEHRRFVRWQIGRQAKIKLLGREACADCQVEDISYKGLKVSSAERLEKDKYINLTLLFGDEMALNVEAWVAWHKTVDGHNIYGLYFNRISDPDKEKIYQFIRKNCPNQMSRQWWQLAKKGGETMEKNGFSDRRIFERFYAKIALRFLDLNSNREGKAQTVDISANGIGMVTSEELAPRTPLEIWLEIPDKAEPLYTRGEVAWVKQTQPDKYRVGVNLEGADLMGISRILRLS